jgi:hypothetical protein
MKKKFTFVALTLLLGLFSWSASAQNVSIYGATGISDGSTYATIKDAFDAINANTSGVNTDNISVRIDNSTTETATAVLSPSKGVNTLTTATGSGYQAPVITLTGGTTSAAGSVTTTITNGVITSITMTGATWTVAATVSIATPAGGGTRATATASGTSGNTTFIITNGGTGYGPNATFTGDGTGAAVNVIMTTAATTVSGAGPRTITPDPVGLTYALTCPGSGYTSAPTCAISAVAGGTGATVDVASLYPSIEFGKLAIYPTVAGATISGAVGLISIVGRTNVTIDGRVNRTGTPTVGSTDNLTISSTHATNPTIAFNSNAQNDTVQYCTLKGQQATTSLGILNFGTGASLTNGNGLNVIDHNLFAPSGTIPQYGIYAQGNSAFPNVSNKITNNEFKDLIAQYNTSTTINILGGVTTPQNDNYTISGNSFYNSLLNCYTADQKNREIIRIGLAAASFGGASFGGSHTISGNYIGGSAAGCSGTLTKTAIAAPFFAMTLFLSPSVSGGGLSRIDGNTIKNISWANDYFPASWTGINIAGTGGVFIGSTTPNSIGDNTTNGSITVSNTGAASANIVLISIGTTGSVVCQNNKIGSITGLSNTANYSLNVTCITKTAGAGTTTISNNIIGSTTQTNSISSTSSGTLNQAFVGINCQGTVTNTISNNTIANIANTSTTGNNYGININGAGATTTVNGNLVHSISITGATGGLLLGIYSANGTNTITNNIVKLGDNNPAEIRAMGDASGATSTSNYHNTIYVSGNPASGALGSACIWSGGTTNIRNYKNNILVNTRTNSGGSATGKHYGLNATVKSGAGTISANGNDYVSTGTNGFLGRYSTDKTALPIVTGNDANSVTVTPSFVNAGGTAASDYKLTSATSMTGVSGTSVGFDYDGATRGATGIIGAFEMASLTTSATTLDGLNYKSGSGPSVVLHSFDVSGDAISGNITVTAPTNFEVSKTGVTSEFTPSVTVAAISGSVATTPIYVRLVAGLSANTYTGDVTVAATGADSKTVACTGIVDVPTGMETIASGVRVFASFGAIKVIGATAGDAIEVYNGLGQKVKTLTANQNDMSITLSSKGIYVIKVGSSANKIILQ